MKNGSKDNVELNRRLTRANGDEAFLNTQIDNRRTRRALKAAMRKGRNTNVIM